MLGRAVSQNSRDTRMRLQGISVSQSLLPVCPQESPVSGSLGFSERTQKTVHVQVNDYMWKHKRALSDTYLPVKAVGVPHQQRNVLCPET